MLKRLWRRPLRILPSLEAYALWAASYPAQAHNPLMALEQAAMTDLLPPLAGRHVLDVACGSGRYLALAHSQGAVAVGVDNSLPMLRLATGAVAAAEGDRLPFADGQFDVVICGLAIGHLGRIQPLLAELGRVLRSGGTLVVSDLHPYQTLNHAQRTFRGEDGRTYAVEHHLHTMETTVAALTDARLTLTALREPLYDDMPVVLAWRASKGS